MTLADQVRSLTALHLGIDPETVTDEALFRDDLGGRFAGCVRVADGV